MAPRRRVLAALAGATCAPLLHAADANAIDLRWIAQAQRQRQRALSWDDQPYGAVVVVEGQLVGEGPSRVVQLNDPNAHAERIAIADALSRLQRTTLAGGTLYSTSRPCRVCEAAAARAGISRLVFGEQASDGGAPRP